MSCPCGKHKTPQACAGARHLQAHSEIWRKPKQRRPRVALSKPCARGGCTGQVTAFGEKTLARRDFCGHRCAYLERLRVEGRRWCHALTVDERRRGATIAGRRVGERNHRRALIAAAKRAMALLPRDVIDILTPLQLSRLRVGVGRVWLDGRQVGYGAKAYRRRKEKAA